MVAIFPGSLPFMKSLNELSPPLGAPMAFTLGPRDKAATDPEPSDSARPCSTRCLPIPTDSLTLAKPEGIPRLTVRAHAGQVHNRGVGHCSRLH